MGKYTRIYNGIFGSGLLKPINVILAQLTPIQGLIQSKFQNSVLEFWLVNGFLDSSQTLSKLRSELRV